MKARGGHRGASLLQCMCSDRMGDSGASVCRGSCVSRVISGKGEIPSSCVETNHIVNRGTSYFFVSGGIVAEIEVLPYCLYV